MNKKAKTSVPLISQIENRWSPRSFLEKPIGEDNLKRILEAARWAPSCFNEQPWRFIVGIKGLGRIHADILSVLDQGNQIWAKRAPVLLLLSAKTNFTHNNKHNKWAEYDAGQAAAYMTIQAMDLNIFIHQMAGFDRHKVSEIFNLEEEYKPVTAIALGYRGDSSALTGDLKKSEESERHRKNLNQLFLHRHE